MHSITQLKGSKNKLLLSLLPDIIKDYVYIAYCNCTSHTYESGVILFINKHCCSKTEEVTHELSHWIQFRRTNKKKTTRELKKILDSEMNSFKNCSNYEEIIDIFVSYTDIDDLTKGIQDIVYGYTKDENLDFHHDSDYYTREKYNLYYEAFAHIGSAILMGGDTLAIMKTYFPKSVDYVQTIYNKLKIKENNVTPIKRMKD